MDSIEKNIDILSFDGGGSRGIMELYILDDVLRLSTIMLRRPETVKSYLVKNENDGNEENVLKDPDIRKRLIDDLREVTDPIHPTDVYEMIVGTSTGALIAFGLVGGKEEDGKRAPMSVRECIKMYLTNTEAIFKKSYSQWFVSHIPGLSSIPLIPYSQDNVRKVLLEQFGDSCLDDFCEASGSKCVAGAVARKLGNEEELVLFDTRNEDYRLYKIYQVLLATSNAPVYFDTPVSIGSDDFVDGGVGGNCPLAQAIPRAKELFGKDGKDAEITSVLSVAPPRSSGTEVPRKFQIKYWMNYFVNESTDGYAVFRHVAKSNRRKKTLFQRLSPRGEALKVFKLDEIDAQKMLDAMEKEKVENDMFLIDVIATAMQVVFTSIDKVPDYDETSLSVAAQLAQTAGRAYQSKEEYDSAIVSYKTSIRLYKKFTTESSKDFTLSKIYYQIAKCLKEQGKYQSAIESFKSNMQVLISHHDPNSDTLLLDTLMDLAECYISTFRYEDAETCLKEFFEKNIIQYKLVCGLSDMAWCKQEQGKLDEAVEQYRHAIRCTASSDNLEKAEILNNLGLCFVRLGMNVEALKSIREAQKIRNRLCTDESDLVAESLHNVGMCLIATGSYDEAHENLTKAHEIYKKIGDDIDISIVLLNLARCLSLSNKDHDLALVYAQQALAKTRKHVGDLHNPGIARILAIVGLCLFKARRFVEAEENLLKSTSMVKKLFRSKNHPWLLENYEILSDLYEKVGKQTTAEFYKTEAQSICEKIQKMAKSVGEH